ncbi:uncharacterized protein SCODWIG_00628 [Saccharomycodes ludwigii]|uniref:Transcription factor CPH1 n=1 Tax=Saccharomycodes ludwigii TaxID=36035 RepID=A0A376B2H7_9ASCO|nr:hypothetical protein SCDLUD_004867 [Saccharomycodes ludwigii]KAH3899424.1 hypothetical protein SCDLUD_004867 [Saccharomycodes ludwigii]SSD58867.1 uncharacterized protein SCODWIG_00628 [Saccharomycodes ludwigii]
MTSKDNNESSKSSPQQQVEQKHHQHKPTPLNITDSHINTAPFPLLSTAISRTTTSNQSSPQHDEVCDNLKLIEDLKFFLATAPANWQENQIIRRYYLSNDDGFISCVFWNNLYYITGTDIVRCCLYRMEKFGRKIIDKKKFEEGIFSDLRNLKTGQDATLEQPKSDFLQFLHKNMCLRTQKKQKVFFWFSVQHDKIFADALERDLKRELIGQKSTTMAMKEPALSFKYSEVSNSTLYDQLATHMDFKRMITPLNSGGIENDSNNNNNTALNPDTKNDNNKPVDQNHIHSTVSHLTNISANGNIVPQELMNHSNIRTQNLMENNTSAVKLTLDTSLSTSNIKGLPQHTSATLYPSPNQLYKTALKKLTSGLSMENKLLNITAEPQKPQSNEDSTTKKCKKMANVNADNKTTGENEETADVTIQQDLEHEGSEEDSHRQPTFKKNYLNEDDFPLDYFPIEIEYPKSAKEQETPAFKKITTSFFYDNIDNLQPQPLHSALSSNNANGYGVAIIPPNSSKSAHHSIVTEDVLNVVGLEEEKKPLKQFTVQHDQQGNATSIEPQVIEADADADIITNNPVTTTLMENAENNENFVLNTKEHVINKSINLEVPPQDYSVQQHNFLDYITATNANAYEQYLFANYYQLHPYTSGLSQPAFPYCGFAPPALPSQSYYPPDLLYGAAAAAAAFAPNNNSNNNNNNGGGGGSVSACNNNNNGFQQQLFQNTLVPKDNGSGVKMTRENINNASVNKYDNDNDSDEHLVPQSINVPMNVNNMNNNNGGMLTGIYPQFTPLYNRFFPYPMMSTSPITAIPPNITVNNVPPQFNSGVQINPSQQILLQQQQQKQKSHATGNTTGKVYKKNNTHK